ncbi:MAG TPA: PHP domain-containing protein [Actinomycetota bacterium]|nr:PHP domain-containing protein [Actinomycetota bacterium]
MRIDLHTHSSVSDGALPPAQVARAAKAAGLDCIALTDHDSMAGIPEARATGDAIGLAVIAGCELSAVLEHKPVHMLGYFLDASHPRLSSELAAIRDFRLRRAERMVATLNELGVPITYDRVREIASGESVGRPHVAQAMVEAGVIATTNDAFTDEWIGNNGRAYLEKTALSPREAVALIREAGGAAVIAHPIWVEGPVSAEELIRDLAGAGLAGVEVDHPDHDGQVRERFRALADELDLVATGSSDYHGNSHGGALGGNTTSPGALERLRERAKAAV